MERSFRYITILAAGLVLFSCKNGEAPTLAEMGYQPNDLAELKKSPEYVDLSKYVAEDPEESNVPEKSPKERVVEDDLPTVHIKYDKPINGYTVTVDLHPGWNGETLDFYGPAEMHFKKGNSGFTVKVDSFEEDHFDFDTILHDGETITLKHTPLPKGKMLSEKCTFFFSDVDFDGTKELIYVARSEGWHGESAYYVYELDGTQRKDDPFYGDLTSSSVFNASEKSITTNRYNGVIIGSDLLKFKKQADGRFQITDSTHIDYKVDFTDSIRIHYRKQGDEMVLVKTEVVK